MRGEAAVINAAYREHLRTLMVICFASHESTDPVARFRSNLASARSRRDGALAILREKPETAGAK
jgi:hypothetical protein